MMVIINPVIPDLLCGIACTALELWIYMKGTIF